ncbi:MAG TPA: ATPase, T2SS/T4P/T4SS family [Anaerolineales bacterium]|nr:ATPase, T2SS/T4P/T4SS family [Anaerolineales bacterium]
MKILDGEDADELAPPDGPGRETAYSPFELTDGTIATVALEENPSELDGLWDGLLAEGLARKAAAAVSNALSPQEVENLARAVFREFEEVSHRRGRRLPEAFLTRLIGEISGLGGLLELIARPEVEDIAVNLNHVYAFTRTAGWEPAGRAPDGLGDALRVLMDRAGQRTPTPDFPVADAMLQVMVPLPDGSVERKGLRISYIMPPASPYGDLITLRVGNYQSRSGGGLAELCRSRLPAVRRPTFTPRDFPDGDGLLTPAAANYLLAVMVRGGTLVIAGSTGSGKTYLAQRLLQETLDFYPPGAIRLFVIEDANEIVLNGWSGDPTEDTGNVIYTVTRGDTRGGPPPVSMYDLIRAALRARPHGIIIGESRGAEAWELVRAAATGHGFSAFTIHATGADHVWGRFFQVVQAHPDARKLEDYQIAQSYAEAVCAVVHIERHPVEGQVVREICEVSPVVERAAARPAFSPLFVRPAGGKLVPTGSRPVRPGFRPEDLGLPETQFRPR